MTYSPETIKKAEKERITPWWVKTLDESSEEELYQYAKNKTNSDVRLAALRRINNLEILRQLERDLQEDREYSLSHDACRRRVNLTVDPAWAEDPEVWRLENPERNPNLESAQIAAVDALSDERAFQNVVLNAPSAVVKFHAARKISDHQELLIEITRNSPDKDAREAATEYLTDPDELRRVALEDPHHFVRYEALRKVDDPAVIDRALDEDESELVRETAIKKTNNGELLLKKLKQTTNPDEEVAILTRLTEIAPLEALDPLMERYERENLSMDRWYTLVSLLRKIYRSTENTDIRQRISPTGEDYRSEWDDHGCHEDITIEF